MLDQRLRRWPNVEPTLAECTMFKKKLSCQYTLLGQFRNPRSNKVTQLRARAITELCALVKLLTHRCHSSIYRLAMIWTLALIRQRV